MSQNRCFKLTIKIIPAGLFFFPIHSADKIPNTNIIKAIITTVIKNTLIIIKAPLASSIVVSLSNIRMLDSETTMEDASGAFIIINVFLITVVIIALIMLVLGILSALWIGKKNKPAGIILIVSLKHLF